MLTKYRKLLSILGVVAPLYFFLLTTILSLFWSEFNINSDYVSNLGSDGSPVATVMNIFGFALFGLIMIGIGFHFRDEMQDGYFTKLGSRLLILTGILIVLLGVFPADHNTLVLTPDGLTHKILSGFVFVLAPISIIFSGMAFHQDPKWNKLWIFFSYILAAIALLTVVIMELSHQGQFIGLLERLGIGVILFWIFLVSLRFYFDDILNEESK